jgi:hypothetical protein
MTLVRSCETSVGCPCRMLQWRPHLQSCAQRSVALLLLREERCFWYRFSILMHYAANILLFMDVNPRGYSQVTGVVIMLRHGAIISSIWYGTYAPRWASALSLNLTAPIPEYSSFLCITAASLNKGSFCVSLKKKCIAGFDDQATSIFHFLRMSRGTLPLIGDVVHSMKLQRRPPPHARKHGQYTNDDKHDASQPFEIFSYRDLFLLLQQKHHMWSVFLLNSRCSLYIGKADNNRRFVCLT